MQASSGARRGPLDTRSTEPRTLVQPVSQVAFRLRPDVSRNPLEYAAKAVLKWMNDRAGQSLPPQAWSLGSFELADVGAQRAAAVSLSDPRIWSARLDDADKVVPLRTWITEVGVGSLDSGDVIFATRLICATRGEMAPFNRTIPGFVFPIFRGSDCLVDGIPASTAGATVVQTDSDVELLAKLIESPTRRLPVVVFSLPERSEDPKDAVMETGRLWRATLGASHIRIITGRASYRLTEEFGKELSVFRMAVRTYRPGFDKDQDAPWKHPLALPERIEKWADQGPAAFERSLIDSVLALSVQRGDREDELPSFTDIRQFAAQAERKSMKLAGASSADLLQLYEEDNDRLRAENQQQRAEYESLLIEADRLKDLAEQALQESRSQHVALQARVRALKAKLSGAAQEEERQIPPTLEGFEDWCAEHLTGQVELLNRAFQGAKKSRFRDPSLIYRSLLLLRDFYLPMRIEGGAARRDAWEAACRELQLEDTPIGSVKGHEDEYMVMWRGQPKMLDKHLKRGRSHDPELSFRLYYFFSEEELCVVVGWLPSHLSSPLS